MKTRTPPLGKSGSPTSALQPGTVPSSSSLGAIPDPPRVLYIYVPLTTQNRGSDYEVDPGRLPFVRGSNESAANVQGIGALPEPRFIRKLGQLPDEKLESVKEALRFAMEL